MTAGRGRRVAGAWLVGLAALAATERIDVTPVVARGKVLASFAAPSSLTPDVQEIVRSGLLVTFTFFVELKRPSALWFDQTVGATTVAASVKFDNLTGVYQVSKLVGEQVVWSEQTRQEGDVRLWMTSFEKVPIEPRVPLEPNVEYAVHVRLRTSPKRTFSIWPWSGDAASGRADFTYIR